MLSDEKIEKALRKAQEFLAQGMPAVPSRQMEVKPSFLKKAFDELQSFQVSEDNLNNLEVLERKVLMLKNIQLGMRTDPAKFVAVPEDTQKRWLPKDSIDKAIAATNDAYNKAYMKSYVEKRKKSLTTQEATESRLTALEQIQIELESLEGIGLTDEAFLDRKTELLNIGKGDLVSLEDKDLTIDDIWNREHKILLEEIRDVKRGLGQILPDCPEDARLLERLVGEKTIEDSKYLYANALAIAAANTIDVDPAAHRTFLGEGAFGKVELVEVQLTEPGEKAQPRLCAVKTVKRPASMTAKKWEDAKKELAEEFFKGMALEENKHVVKFYGIKVLDNGDVEVYTEYVEPMDKRYGNLEDVLSAIAIGKEQGGAAPFTAWQAANLALGVVKGINHIQKNSVLHRDLAARNVILSKHGDTKIADFGRCEVLRATREAPQGLPTTKTRKTDAELRGIAFDVVPPELTKTSGLTATADAPALGYLIAQIYVPDLRAYLSKNKAKIARKTIKNLSEFYREHTLKAIEFLKKDNPEVYDTVVGLLEEKPENRLSYEGAIEKLEIAKQKEMEKMRTFIVDKCGAYDFSIQKNEAGCEILEGKRKEYLSKDSGLELYNFSTNVFNDDEFFWIRSVCQNESDEVYRESLRAVTESLNGCLLEPAFQREQIGFLKGSLLVAENNVSDSYFPDSQDGSYNMGVEAMGVVNPDTDTDTEDYKGFGDTEDYKGFGDDEEPMRERRAFLPSGGPEGGAKKTESETPETKFRPGGRSPYK